MIVPRSYPVTSNAVVASGIDRRETPRTARSFGHEIDRSPGTRTRRWSSSPRRTNRDFTTAATDTPRAAAASSTDETAP